MSRASEWGVPDWLRLQDYPAPEGPGAMVIWAWEFLRRNEKFRDFWVNKVEPFIRADGRISMGIPYHEMKEKFGIEDPWSPRQNSRIPTFSDLKMTICDAPASIYEPLPDSAEPPGPFGLVRASRENLNKGTILEISKLSLSWFEMGFAIDLRLPIDDQLKAIRMLAEEFSTRP